MKIPLKRTLFFLILVLFFTNCNKSKTAINIQQEKILAEDFDSFYNQFHSDSLFQMARIKFPLEGENIDGFKKTKWTKENWNLLKTKIYDVDTTKFKTNYKKTNTGFIEKCYTEDSGFSSEYRFKMTGNKWYLVYAIDKNL